MLKQLALVSGDPSKDTSLEKEDVQDLNPGGADCIPWKISRIMPILFGIRKKRHLPGIDAEYRSKYLLANTLGKRFQILRTLLNPVNLSIAGFAEDASEAVGAIFCSSS